MIKVSITRQGVITNEAQFPTQSEAEAWVDQQNDAGSFGKPAGWYYGDALTEEEKALATEIQTEDQNGQPIPSGGLYLLPAQYSVTYTDITVELAEQAEIQKYLTRMEFGKLIMAKLAQKNLKRLMAGETTVEALVSAEAKLEVVQRLLLNGSTSLALGAIQQVSPILTEYPESLKLELITEIQTYLASE